MLDPISDMLTRIRNASQVGHPDVLVPWSKFKMKIAEILLKKKFVSGVLIEEEDRKKIRLNLRYMKNDKEKTVPYFQGLRRVSKEGQRIYVGKDKLPRTKNGYGFSVISTSQGLMTDGEARKAGLGGEVICEIW